MDKDLEKISFMLRGGAFNFKHQSNIRASFGLLSDSMLRFTFYGFRCCKPASCLKQVERWKDETEGGLFDG